jgi:hypothetical protein
MKKKIFAALAVTVALIILLSLWYIYMNSQKKVEGVTKEQTTIKTTVQITSQNIANDFRNSLTEDEYTKHVIKKGNYKMIYFVKDHFNKEEGVLGSSAKWIYGFLYDQGTSKSPSCLTITTDNGALKTSETQSFVTMRKQPSYIVETDSKALRKGRYRVTLKVGHISVTRYKSYKKTHNKLTMKNKVTFTITFNKK